MTGRKIFVCYRREDSAGHAGRLYDRLNLRFSGRVFMDVAAIGLGTRWGEVIESTLASCEVVLLLIGRRWLEKGPDGRRRIDAADDPLRAEIATALKLERTIVPVLVGGAAMPDRDELPAAIAAVADWQALRVDDDDFDHDAERLTRALEGHLQEERDDPHLDERAARERQIEALFEESRRAVRAGDWVMAAQTLRSILSLDPGNARAAAEWRSVEAQWAEAWRRGQAASAAAPRRHSWAAIGIVGVIVVVFGVAATLLAVLVILAEYDPEPGGAQVGAGMSSLAEPTPPVDADDDVNPPASDGSIDATPGALPARLVGRWMLAAYSQQGLRLPVVGEMTLSDAGAGRLRFETQALNQTTGGSFWYRGLLQQQGGGAWTTLTTESNDPTVVAHPVPTEIHLDGAVLTTVNAYGQAAVWHRQ